MNRTYSPKAKDVNPQWHIIDAKDKPVGRLASQIAIWLIGKHKTTYSPHIDMGDHVVVINSAKVRATGRKETQKIYYRYSGYPGGLTMTPLGKMREEHPDRIIKFAVSGMLPQNKLRDPRLKKLHVYADETHPYQDKFKSQ